MFGATVDQIGKLTHKDMEINKILKEDTQHFLERAVEIMASMKEQKKAVNEIVTSVSHINNAAQNTSAASEELFASTEGIAHNAEKLKTEIDFFKL